MCLNDDRSQIFTASHDGFVTFWNAKTGENDRVEGKGHGNQITRMKVVGNSLYTCGFDDNLKQVDLSTYNYDNTKDVKLGSQPRGMDISNGKVYIGTVKEVTAIYNFLLVF